jgi:DNA polymerase I-like protein with 3'-5' exonuclease and polymerase domains
MIIFDIETNGIEDWAGLSDLKEVHCISWTDDGVNVQTTTSEDGEEALRKLLKRFEQEDAVCGHNAILFDCFALDKLYGFKPKKIVDTHVMSSCIYPDLDTTDWAYWVNVCPLRAQPKLIGSHSLKAWGVRLKNFKGDFGDTGDWSKLTAEMVTYCEQDVRVTYALYDHLMRKKPNKQMLVLEHEFASIIAQQYRNGWPFDKKAAEKLEGELSIRLAKLKEELQEVFGPTIETMKSQYWEACDGSEYLTLGEAKKAGFSRDELKKGRHRTKEIPFNPASRDQIAERLMADGWKPAAYEGKRPIISDVVLEEIGTEKALKLRDYLLVNKRLGQIATGKQAWLSHISKKGRIHGSVRTNGAVSGRCTHSNPNVAQVPAVSAEYGKECRSLFTAPKGKVMVGADASGLELRCLSHYLHRYDGGAYAKTILEGDIHTANQEAAGLKTRDQAKTFIYAFIYGGGDGKIGEIAGGSRTVGKRLKQNFMKKIPAMGQLMKAVKNACESRHYLVGLDGRVLPCRSSHSALNLLLQSAGAVVMKQALVVFVRNARKAGLPFELHGNIHDEIQFSCLKEHADQLGQMFCDALAEAGRILKFNCPLDGEYKVGSNWAETH